MVIFSPAPIGSVAVIINIPRRAARSFIAIPVVLCRRRPPDFQKPRLVPCRLVRHDELLCKSQTSSGRRKNRRD
jgi:hypothetical protein